MTGCVALRKDVYYVRLTYYDKGRQRKEKWVSTGLSGKGSKKKATAMIDSISVFSSLNNMNDNILCIQFLLKNHVRYSIIYYKQHNKLS